MTNVKAEYNTGVFDSNVVLNVVKENTTIITGTQKTAIEVNGKIIAVYDISFLVDNQKVQPNGTVNISLPIPAEYVGKPIKLIHIKADGSIENVTVTVNNGFAEFVANSFSNYVITENSPNSPNTSDAGILFVGPALFAL